MFIGELANHAKKIYELGMETELLEPVDNIAISPQSYRITKDTAREFARLSWEARRKREAEQAEQAKAGREATPQSVRLAKLLEQHEALMDEETDADTLQKLSAAHSRIFSAWQVLSGTPNPGSAKGRAKPKAPMIQPEPIQPIAIQLASPAQGDMVTISRAELARMIQEAVAAAKEV